MVEEKVFGTGKRMRVNKMRAMSIAGFCTFAKLTHETFLQYEKQEEYSEVCKRIRIITFMQKFEGAAADLLNHAIIARELGLADKTELSGPGGGPIATTEIDYDQLSVEVLDAILKARKQNE